MCFFNGLGCLEDLVVLHGVVIVGVGGGFEGIQPCNNNNKRVVFAFGRMGECRIN